MFVGTGGRSVLLLQGQRLVRLAEDGFAEKETIKLPKRYNFVGMREDYVVCVHAENATVELIDRRTGRERHNLRLPSGRVFDLALHPTKPISYVCFRDSFDIPGCHFIVYDETTGKGRQGDEFIGARLAMDSTGRYLYAGYDDMYRRGSKLLLNPGRLHFVPDYGSISVLLRYDLRDPKNPELIAANPKAGSSGRGLRVAPTGKQVIAVGARRWGPLRGWNTDDFKEMPLLFDIGKPTVNMRIPSQMHRDLAEKANDFAYHPVLPMAAAFAEREVVVLFDTKTGKRREVQVEATNEVFAEGKPRRLWFSPDGYNLLVLMTVNNIPYLHRTKLGLSPQEVRLLKNRRSPATPTRVAPGDLPISLSSLESLSGGLGKQMTAAEISKWFSGSVVIVRSGDSVATGFIVGSAGYVLTCAHCTDTDPVTVTYRRGSKSERTEMTSRAQVLRTDETRDLALLKINPAQDLRPVRLAVNTATAGEDVTVISNPGLGRQVLSNTVTTGTVSSASRTLDAIEYIQTTATVNPGSSGGPVFNGQGLVIGAVVLKGNIEGTGFATPSHELVQFLVESPTGELKITDWIRSWVDASGRHQISGWFAGRSQDLIRLRCEQGNREMTVPVAKLSRGDQLLLEAVKARTQ